jgi:ribonuclease R
MQVLKRGRDKRQPLELDMPERKILLTPEGKVDKVVVPGSAGCPQAD